MKEKVLKQEIERCVEHVQEIVDLESAKAISEFQSKADENYQWLEELKTRYSMRNDNENDIRQLRSRHKEKIDALEEDVNYFEKLLDEMEEFVTELDVKRKLANKRQSRSK